MSAGTLTLPRPVTYTRKKKQKKRYRRRKIIKPKRSIVFSPQDDGNGSFVKARFVVMNDDDLSDSAKIIYFRLLAIAKGSKALEDITIAWMVKAFNKSKNCIVKALITLANKGLISRRKSYIEFNSLRNVYKDEIDKYTLITPQGVELVHKEDETNKTDNVKGQKKGKRRKPRQVQIPKSGKTTEIESAFFGITDGKITFSGISTEVRHDSKSQKVTPEGGFQIPKSEPEDSESEANEDLTVKSVSPAETQFYDDDKKNPPCAHARNNRSTYNPSDCKKRSTFSTTLKKCSADALHQKNASERILSETKRRERGGISFVTKKREKAKSASETSPKAPSLFSEIDDAPSEASDEDKRDMNYQSFIEGVNARHRRESVSEKVDTPGPVAMTAPGVYKLFRQKMLERHPKARLPSMATSKDLKRVKSDVLIYDPEDVTKMIDILIIEWSRLKTSTYPQAPDQALPTFDFLWRYVNRLAVAISEGVGGTGINRGRSYNPETGGAVDDWILEKWGLK